MRRGFLVLLFLLLLLLAAGCTSGTVSGEDIAQGQVRAHFGHTGDWSIGLGCFEKVTGYVYNTGNTSVDTVVLDFNLVDMKSGTIRDSRSVFIGSLAPGQSRTFESDLEGECLPDYRVEAAVMV